VPATMLARPRHALHCPRDSALRLTCAAPCSRAA
jgi:hypothetical protein